MLRYLLLFFLLSRLHSYVVGNFSDPEIYTESISIWPYSNIHFRAGYFSDYMYNITLEEEFATENANNTELGMTSYASILTMNLHHRWDIYAILGSTKMHEKELGFVPRQFSYSLGTKIILLRWGNCCFSIDGKYFTTIQQPCYYVLDGKEPAFVINNLDFTYSEAQVAFGFGYRLDTMGTYLGVTYLDAKLAPNSPFIVLDIPAFGEDSIYSDDGLQNNINKSRFGIVWGFSLIANDTMSLNVESRHIDQNDVNVYGTVRF